MTTVPNLSVDAILFDWGGTLAHVARQVEAWHAGAEAVCRLLAQHGLEHPAAVPTLATIIRNAETNAENDPNHVEVDVRNVVAAWAAACGWKPIDDRLCQDAIDVFGRCWIGCLDPFPGTHEVLRELRRRGYRLALASNCWIPSPYCRAELRRHGFDQFLHGITFSCEVGYRKPARVFYEAAAQAAVGDGNPFLPERMLFVGDSPLWDIAGPAEFGMKTALVRTGPSIWPAEHYDRINPDLDVATVAELLNHLPDRQDGAS